MIFLNFISFKTLRSLCIDLIIFLIPVGLFLFALPHIIGLLSPFIAGFILYMAANPLNRRLKKRLPDGVCAFVSLLFISAVIFFILRAVLMHLLSEVTALTQSSGRLYSETIPFISRKTAAITEKLAAAELFSSLFEALRSQLLEIVSKISAAILSFAKNIPSMLISLFAAVFTAFFLLKDSDTFHAGLKKFFGKKACLRFSEIKDSFLDVTLSYLKAQLIIESIIFTVLFTGFLLLRLDYALLTAFFTAVIDAVPILGTGAVLIPMSVFNFLSGNISLGWGILILYGIALLTRQLCEPKIIGNKLGIHPLLTVFAIYTGMKLFGIAGLILGPIAAIFIKNLILTEKNIR